MCEIYCFSALLCSSRFCYCDHASSTQPFSFWKKPCFHYPLQSDDAKHNNSSNEGANSVGLSVGVGLITKKTSCLPPILVTIVTPKKFFDER